MNAPSAAAHTTRLDTLCDRCPAPARYQVLIPVGGDLLFCLHHFKQHSKKLTKAFVAMPMAGA